MRQFILNNRTILGVEVPKDAHSFELLEGMLSYKASFGPIADVGRLSKLPEGEWQILGRAGDIGEQMIDELFVKESAYAKELGLNSLESFKSWLKANNIPDETVLLIKK